MQTLHKNIQQLTRDNTWFRREVVTGEHSQVMLMCVEAGQEIGDEVHHVDQTLVFVSGSGQAILDGHIERVEAGDLFFVPAGTRHNFINDGTDPLKLFTVYAPNEHVAGTNHETKADADRGEHHGE